MIISKAFRFIFCSLLLMSSARDSSAYSFSDKMDIMGKGFTRPFGKIISTLEWPLSAKAASEKTFYGQNEAVNRAASSQLFLQKLSAEDKIAVTTLSGQQGVSLDYIKASQNKPWFLKIDPVSKMDGKPSKGKWAATFIAFGQRAASKAGRSSGSGGGANSSGGVRGHQAAGRSQ